VTPLITVIVPVHNVHQWVAACLDSVLAQTETDIEVIAVNDGSTDGSGQVCETYAAADSRMRVVHQRNGGLSDARNVGLVAARGEWVLFLDGDDWIDSEAAASMLAAAEAADADVVVAGFHVDVHDAAGTLIRRERRAPVRQVVEASAPRLAQPSTELLNVVGYAWNKLYRRTFLTEVDAAFPVGVSLVEDILFNAPVLQRARRVAFLDEAFVHYVQRPRLTLGTRPQPQFADLMTRASHATSGLLASWGVPSDVSAELVHEVEVGRVQWAVRSVLVAGGPVRPRLSAARGLVRDPIVRSVLAREVARGRLRGPRRWLLVTQAHGSVLPTWVALRARGAGA
jgi:hypothetical protein